ncbi:MAG: DMT family transporter [Planctomycetia bacterium]
MPLTDLVPGVLAGLTAAFFSALSYLISRHHSLHQRAAGRKGATLRLLALAHTLMGAACLPLTLWLWPADSPAAAGFILPLAASVVLYLLGQSALFSALKRVEASRIAPLLGLKIVMLALIVTVVLGEPLDRRQWLAVGLCVAAAFVLQAGHGAVPPAALGFVVASCLCFAGADLGIISLIEALEAGVAAAGGELGRIHAGGLALTLTYAACGLLFLPLLMRLGRLDRADWMASCRYATAWMAAMAGLYCCFGLVGVVLGNILQSTRGMMSVALGMVLAHRGWHELEQKVDRATLVRRIASAALMTAAIAIYVADLS